MVDNAIPMPVVGEPGVNEYLDRDVDLFFDPLMDHGLIGRDPA